VREDEAVLCEGGFRLSLEEVAGCKYSAIFVLTTSLEPVYGRRPYGAVPSAVLTLVVSGYNHELNIACHIRDSSSASVKRE